MTHIATGRQNWVMGINLCCKAGSPPPAIWAGGAGLGGRRLALTLGCPSGVSNFTRPGQAPLALCCCGRGHPRLPRASPFRFPLRRYLYREGFLTILVKQPAPTLSQGFESTRSFLSWLVVSQTRTRGRDWVCLDPLGVPSTCSVNVCWMNNYTRPSPLGKLRRFLKVRITGSWERF